MLSGIYPWTTISSRVKRPSHPHMAWQVHLKLFKNSSGARCLTDRTSKYCHRIQTYKDYSTNVNFQKPKMGLLRGSYQVSNLSSETQFWLRSTSKQQMPRPATSIRYRKELLMWRELAVSDKETASKFSITMTAKNKNRQYATIWLISNSTVAIKSEIKAILSPEKCQSHASLTL